MSDDSPTLETYATRAAFLAGEPSATWENVLAEGPGVYAAMKRDFPDRAAALEQVDARWKRAGKPPGMLRTSAPATEPNPRPEPAPVPVNAPDPASIKSMRDLTQLGASAFTAFKAQHPERYAALAAAAGMPASRQ